VVVRHPYQQCISLGTHAGSASSWRNGCPYQTAASNAHFRSPPVPSAVGDDGSGGTSPPSSRAMMISIGQYLLPSGAESQSAADA
jgi:hypothetical protein